MRITLMNPGECQAIDRIARLGDTEIESAKEAAKEWARIWVARTPTGKDPAGFLLAWLVSDEIHVINVATHPNRRRSGVAKALLAELLTFARANKYRLLLLEVRKSNRPAINLYRSHGFSAIGLRRAYYSDNSEDAIEMVLALDPETGHIQPGRDEIRLAEM